MMWCMEINYKASDYIIDAIDEFIKDVLSELNIAARFYVLDGLGDVISNQRYDLEEAGPEMSYGETMTEALS